MGSGLGLQITAWLEDRPGEMAWDVLVVWKTPGFPEGENNKENSKNFRSFFSDQL